MTRWRGREVAIKTLRVVGEAADSLVQLQRNTSPLGFVAVGAKLATAALDKIDRTPLAGWSEVSGVAPLDVFMLHVCRARQLVSVVGEEKAHRRVLTGTVNGVRVGWVEYERWTDGPYTAGDPEAARAALRQIAWESLGSAVKFHQPALGPAELRIDPVDETLPSQTGLDLWARQEPFLDAGRRCSVLLVGEVGVGKSNIIRFVANKAGGMRLRVRARDLENLRNLGNLVRFLQPSGVLIDDLDRAEKPAGILDEIDEILVAAKLLLVTVNDVGKLDPAVIRRFTDLEVVEQLDDGVITKLIGDAPEEVAARLRKLPVTYLHLFARSVEVLGPDAAIKQVEGLVERRELVRKMKGSGGSKSWTKAKEDGP